jgi:hypothetical protein
MNVQEFFPLMGGLVLGSLLGLLRTSARLRIGVLLTICIGLLATLASGEFRLHWGFVLLDISLVAASVVAGLCCTRLMQSKQALRKN